MSEERERDKKGEGGTKKREVGTEERRRERDNSNSKISYQTSVALGSFGPV